MIQDKKQDTSTLQKKLTFWSADCHHQEIAPYLSLGIAKFSEIATKLGHIEHKKMVWKCLNTASIHNYTYMANPPNPSFISFILYLWKHYPNKNGDKDKMNSRGKVISSYPPSILQENLELPHSMIFQKFQSCCYTW